MMDLHDNMMKVYTKCQMWNDKKTYCLVIYCIILAWNYGKLTKITKITKKCSDYYIVHG